MTSQWKGIFCALFTPTDERGELLEDELRNNLQFVLKQGVHGLMALGSTGEFLHLPVPVRKRLVELVTQIAGDLPVMVNISDIRPAVVMELGRASREYGATAVSLLPPYFYPVPQEDLVEFFVQSGEAAGLPLFLYNFPERTGNSISLETIEAVARRTPVAGVKQSGGDFSYHEDLVSLGRALNFTVLTGSDTRLPEAMRLGAAGCVSGLSNAVPEWMVQLYQSIERGDTGRTNELAGRMDRLGKEIDRLAFPLNVAAAMEARGLSTGVIKPVIAPGTRERFGELVKSLKEWLPAPFAA